MELTETIAGAFAALRAMPWRHKLLALATLVVLVELALRRFARGSRFYAGWTRCFEAIGEVWTAVLLAVVYFVSVSVVSVLVRLVSGDPLDRGLAKEPSYWRSHEPNPLGPAAAARHQF
jgi:hypothetical protein